MARTTPAGAVAQYLRKYPFAPRYRREQAISLTTADGVRLAGACIEGPPDARCTVVLIHGFTNWSRAPRIHAFAQMMAARTHVIVPDLRGHGRSGGTCTFGRNEPLDVAAAVAAARPGLPVVTVGASLGGAAVLLHAAAFGGVQGTVAVSAPAYWGDLGTVGSNRVQRYITTRSGRLILTRLLRTRIENGDCATIPHAGSVAPPDEPGFFLIAHDPGDWYFGPEHAERIYEWAPEPKEMWWYPGGGHGTDLLTREFADRLLREVDRRFPTRA
jgi:pimeloyl-ACP methyl ester carboxylesterase